MSQQILDFTVGHPTSANSFVYKGYDNLLGLLLSPAIGGVLVGLLAVASPLILSDGSNQIEALFILSKELGPGNLIATMSIKLFAVGISLGFGFIGGQLFPLVFGTFLLPLLRLIAFSLQLGALLTALRLIKFLTWRISPFFSSRCLSWIGLPPISSEGTNACILSLLLCCSSVRLFAGSIFYDNSSIHGSGIGGSGCSTRICGMYRIIHSRLRNGVPTKFNSKEDII